MKALPKMVPHTEAKHLLLKKYLDRWFAILGRTQRRINYIDGFAGPGQYEGGEKGSPIHAIESAKAHVEKGNLPPDVEINFLFVEVEPDYEKHLRAQLASLTLPKNFHVDVKPGEFADVVGGILRDIKAEGNRLAPTFAFVDPFGFSGIPFDLLAQILAHPKCEVYINIMIEFINRFIEHPNDRITAHFPTTFGTDKVLEIPKMGGDREKEILSLYRRQLESKARFVGRFDMHGKRDQKTYSLFFASNSPKGFEKMKEANWSLDVGEGGRFSDFEPGAAGQLSLMPEIYLRDVMRAQFRGQRVSMTELLRFVIEQTDYLPKHARAVLKIDEGKGEIAVEVLPGQKRRKGDFPEGKITITFGS
jgi:three-Cys-motif partner protein